MPSSPSSTLNSDAHRLNRRAHLQELVDGNYYKALLLELLAVIHRDGGHYTSLTGIAVSIEEAELQVVELRRKVHALSARVAQLAKERP